MIAVDTNVLLRYLLGDDEVQSAKSRQLFDSGKLVLITDVVLAESLWTLIGRKYGATKEELIFVVEKLLRDPNICFEDNEVVWQAMEAYRDSSADFADALIVYKAVKSGSVQGRLDGFYTFDVDALQLPHAVTP